MEQRLSTPVCEPLPPLETWRRQKRVLAHRRRSESADVVQARGAAAAAIATAAGFPFMGQVLRRFWSPDTEDAMTRYLTVLARTVVETYIDKSSFPSCACDPAAGLRLSAMHSCLLELMR